MGCFWGFCNNRGNWNNNCRCNWNNDCGCNGNDNDNVDCEEEKRRAYWAGFRDGCNNPRCRWRNENDNDDCGC